MGSLSLNRRGRVHREGSQALSHAYHAHTTDNISTSHQHQLATSLLSADSELLRPRAPGSVMIIINVTSRSLAGAQVFFLMRCQSARQRVETWRRNTMMARHYISAHRAAPAYRALARRCRQMLIDAAHAADFRRPWSKRSRSASPSFSARSLAWREVTKRPPRREFARSTIRSGFIRPHTACPASASERAHSARRAFHHCRARGDLPMPPLRHFYYSIRFFADIFAREMLLRDRRALLDVSRAGESAFIGFDKRCLRRARMPLHRLNGSR